MHVNDEGFVSADVVMEEMLKTFRERSAAYKSNYLMIGDALEKLFPDGVVLRTAYDHNRWHLYLMVLVKATRLACTDLEHVDSAMDMSVYSAMFTGLIKSEPK